MPDSKTMTYAGTGVDYGAMDPFKRAAQGLASKVTPNLSRLGASELTWTRGESCYLLDLGDVIIGHVEEGLGSKNLVADAMQELTGLSSYDRIAQCTVAMIVNDMITVGAMPLSVAMHLAVGESSWFDDEDRSSALLIGWQRACRMAKCAWGGGETPTLKGIVIPGTSMLAGSATGIIRARSRLITPENIRHGDAIVLIGSSGIHANGLTMARAIAAELPGGYLAKMPDGQFYGDALLEPTHIYVGLVEACMDAGVRIHYAVNVTGHGWRKLMRAPRPFAYMIDHLPRQLPIFDFIQKHGRVTTEEMYGNFNMGAGFALYVPDDDAEAVVDIAQSEGFEALRAGSIFASDEPRVIINPLRIQYEKETLGVR